MSGQHTFEPGARAVGLAVLVVLILVALTLPWLGSRTGWGLLLGGAEQGKIGGLAPRVFAALLLTSALLITPMALRVRRYGAAWIAELGCDVTWLFGGLAIWSQQSTASHQPGPGPSVGLILAEPAVMAMAAIWVRIVWKRSPEPGPPHQGRALSVPRLGTPYDPDNRAAMAARRDGDGSRTHRCPDCGTPTSGPRCLSCTPKSSRQTGERR